MFSHVCSDTRANSPHLKGKYTVLADVYTKDDAKVICLEATVHF